MKPYLHRGLFVRLREPGLFRSVRVVAGSLEWPGGIDLSYDTVYVESAPFEGEPELAENIIHVREQPAGYHVPPQWDQSLALGENVQAGVLRVDVTRRGTVWHARVLEHDFSADGGTLEQLLYNIWQSLSLTADSANAQVEAPVAMLLLQVNMADFLGLQPRSDGK